MDVVSVEDLNNKASIIAEVTLPGFNSSIAVYDMAGFEKKTFYVIFVVDIKKKRGWETVKLLTAVEVKKTVFGGYVDEGKYLLDMVHQYPDTADSKKQIQMVVNNLIRAYLNQSSLVA